MKNKKNKKSVNLTVTIKQEISLYDVECLLCSAFEGGSNYWYEIVEFVKPSKKDLYVGDDMDDKHKLFPHLQYPLSEGGAVMVQDKEGDDENVYRLDLPAIRKGLQIMAENHAHHFANVLTGNGDAETGDVFLQCCLFGDTVYG